MPKIDDENMDEKKDGYLHRQPSNTFKTMLLTSYGRESGAKIMTLSYPPNIYSYFIKTFFQIKGHV